MWCVVCTLTVEVVCSGVCFFFQAEDGIRYLVRSRGLGDVYKRQVSSLPDMVAQASQVAARLNAALSDSNLKAISETLSLIHI